MRDVILCRAARVCGALASGLLAATTPSQAAPTLRPAIIDVAPDGHEAPTGGGVPSGPVATLDNAMAIVAALRVSDPARPITVQLARGVYRLEHPVRIDSAQAGSGAAPLIIRGAPDGTSVLTGSIALDAIADPLPAADADRLTQAALDHVRLYRLPRPALASRSIGQVSLLRARPTRAALELYDNTGALVPARWPSIGWAHLSAGSTPPASATFTIAGAPAASWAGEPDLWAEGYFRFDWLYETVPVASVDPLSGQVLLRTPPDEGVIKPGARVRLSHTLSALNGPGQWWRDEDRGLLLAWPRPNAGALEVAVAERLLVIENAHHVRLEALTLTHALADALLVHDSDDITVAHSTIAWVAGRGAVFENATRSGLEDCTITQTGRAGARLIGGDRAKLVSSGLYVRHSRFSGYARLALTQQAGAEIDGVGVSIESSVFSDAGSAAITIHGNDHRIAGNEFTRLLSGVTDDGAIYAGRDWTSRGTVITRNFLHDIRPDPGFETKGIYLDDEASGFTITDNLFLRVDQPVFIGGGRESLIEGNVFVAASPAIHVDSRGETWAATAIADPGSELRAAFAAMPVTSPVWRAHYPTLATTLTDEPAVGKEHRLVRNTFVLSTPFDFSDGGHPERQIIADNHGPEGLLLPSGADLGALASLSRDPRVFAGLRDTQGKPVGLDLGPAYRAGAGAPPRPLP